MAAPTNAANVNKALANSEPSHMARNRPIDSAEQRPELGAKQTQGGHTGMSQCDPERKEGQAALRSMAAGPCSFYQHGLLSEMAKDKTIPS
jgi:hypothetical protein